MSQSKAFLLVIAITIFVIMGISGGLLNIAWTYMQITFDVSVGAIGILLLFATTGSLIAAMSSGTLIGRYGIGRVSLIAVLILSLGLLGIGFSPTWFALLGIIFFMFLGRGTLDSSMNSFVSENYGTSAMNWLHAGWGLGLTIAPFVITFILIDLEMTWRAAYIVTSGVTFLLALVILFNLKKWTLTQTDDEEAEKSKIIRASVQETLRQPVVILSIVFFFLYAGVEIGIGQLANTLFVLGRDSSQEQASLWISFYWGSFTIGRMFLGVIALRVNDKILIRTSFTIVLIGAFLLTTNYLPLMNMLSLILLGIGLSGIFPTLISQTPARVGRRFSTQAIGFQIGFAGLGGAIIPGTIGALGEQISLETIADSLFVIVVVTVIVYAFLARRYPVVSD